MKNFKKTNINYFNNFATELRKEDFDELINKMKKINKVKFNPPLIILSKKMLKELKKHKLI